LKDELDAHISGSASTATIQKDLMRLTWLLQSRSQKKEEKMRDNMDLIPERMIWDAFDHGSSVIHIYPAKGKYEISYRTSKGLEKLIGIQDESFSLIDEALAKIASGTENNKRINLMRDAESEESDLLQVNYQKLDTVTGPRVTLRLWQTEKDVLSLDKITSDKTALESFKKIKNGV